MHYLIIINGLPCTGKSRLAEELSRSLHIPSFSKDQIRELFADRLENHSLVASQPFGIACEELLFSLGLSVLRSGGDVILESTFVAKFADRDIRRLREKIDGEIEVFQICCTSDEKARRLRLQERIEAGERHPLHHPHDRRSIDAPMTPPDREEFRLEQANHLFRIDWSVDDVQSIVERVTGMMKRVG